MLGCADSSAAACLNLCNVIANGLLHRVAKLKRHLMRAAGFLRHLGEQDAHALHHLVTLVGGILDYIDGQALGGFQCVVEHISDSGWRRVSHADNSSIGRLDAKSHCYHQWCETAREKWWAGGPNKGVRR